MRLVETAHMKVEEAALTGESVPVEKHTEVLPDEEVPLGDRGNMAYKGTFVTSGRGMGVVAETAMKTEFARSPPCCRRRKRSKPPFRKE
jgi:Ca2+-transporting ATPase